MTIEKMRGRSVELVRPGLQSGNRSNTKASWMQQQLSNPLRNVRQIFCLSTCTEIQTAVQSDALMATMINTLSVKANMGLLLDSKPATSFQDKVLVANQ